MDRSAERRLIALVFLLYAVIITWSTCVHGMWLDELQPWCVARDSGSLVDLYHNTRHEFHPPVWYVLLYFITRFTSAPFSMQVVHLMIALSTAAVVLWRAPFPLWWRASILFGYFFLFEYSVMARNYGLVVLGLLVAVDARKNHGPGWKWAMALVFAALSHLWGTALAVAMLLGEVCSGKRERMIGPALFIVIACGAAVLWAWPASHAPRLSVVDELQLPNALARIATSTTQGLLPWPNLANDPVWNHNVIHDNSRLVSALLGLALIALLWWCTPREVSARVFFWSAFVGCLALPIMGGAYEVRHYGPLWIGWIILQWGWAPVERRAKNLTSGLLAAQMVGGVLAMDMTVAATPLSEACRLPSVVTQAGAEDLPVVLDAYTASPSVSGYLQKPVLRALDGSTGSFCDGSLAPYLQSDSAALAAVEQLPWDNFVWCTARHWHTDTLVQRLGADVQQIGDLTRTLVPSERLTVLLVRRP
ncbi:MAG: hypothetical protein IPJ76_04250 [Flavobacteriales bacterium]|nr:MAG: hypothetical protein IPJ76_04250 [Flavobacteriales bacterium]